MLCSWSYFVVADHGTRSNQIRIQGSQERIQSSQVRVESGQDRLEESQARIESQIREILASRKRQATPLLSNSLDASSPEGRQTWMNLGRTLRKEGITPGMIEKNQSLLVRALKDTLGRAAPLTESIDESYKTAREYHISPQQDSTPLLGSAPPSVATFSFEFLQRHKTNPNPIDHDENIASGISSLMEGMSGNDSQSQDLENDFAETDELTDAEAAAMMFALEGQPAPTRNLSESEVVCPAGNLNDAQFHYDVEYLCKVARRFY